MTRQASVHAGLEALARHAPDFVLIHDAARPFLTSALITRAIDAAVEHRAAVPAVAIADTVKKVDERETVTETLDRSRLRLVQTPQAFGFDLIIAAHQRAAAAGRDDFTDDAALAEWAGHRVTVFAGEASNVKLTTNDDFIRAEALRMAALADVRTGNGFDVHAFVDGDHVMLGGIRIPHTRGLTGHSDADVVLHALVDALSGRAGRRRHRIALPAERPAMARRIVRPVSCFRLRACTRAWRYIAHLDATVVCEAPRIGPHRDAMRARIAAIADIPLGTRRGQGNDQREARIYRPR